jgi:hypothetical protein
MVPEEDTVELPIVSAYYTNYPPSTARTPSNRQALATVSIALTFSIFLIAMLWFVVLGGSQ